MTIRAVLVGVEDPDPFDTELNNEPIHFNLPHAEGVLNDIAWYEGFLDRQAKALTTPLDIAVLKQPSDCCAANIQKTISSKVSALVAGDVFVLVLSGHGFQVSSESLTQEGMPNLDASTTELFAAQDTYVPNHFFETLWKDAPWDVCVLNIIDTCSSDGIVFLNPPEPSVVQPPDETRRDGTSRITIAAVDERSTARGHEYPDGWSGILTHSLREAWQRDKATASYNDWLTSAVVRAVLTANQAPVIRVVGPWPSEVLEIQPFTPWDSP